MWHYSQALVGTPRKKFLSSSRQYSIYAIDAQILDVF